MADGTPLTQRSLTELGTSTLFQNTSSCDCLYYDEDGKVQDCNCVYMPYCDGASFAGFVADPVPARRFDHRAPRDAELYFRGIRNFDATLDLLFAEHNLVHGGRVGPLGWDDMRP